MLERLTRANLKLDLKKCEYAVRKQKYIDFIITADKGVSVDLEKKISIEEWKIPRPQTAVRSFLGFANFYKDFIDNFAKLTAPL